MTHPLDGDCDPLLVLGRGEDRVDLRRIDRKEGLQPADRWLLLMQSFNVVSEGSGSWGYPSYAYYKLQLSAVYMLTPALSLQAGGYTTYWGRNALQENGLVLGAWYKF